MAEPNDRADAHSALDALFTETTGEKPDNTPTPPAPPPPAEPKTDPDPPAPASPEGAPAAPAAAEAVAGLDIKSKAKPEASSTPPAPAPPGSAPATPSAAPETFDSVELPPYSKPKSVEAFAKVKELARADLKVKEEEIARLKAEIGQRDEKLKGVLPPEAAKELEELRKLRRSMDIESDTEFKAQFDQKITANSNAIMTRLQQAGMSEKQLEQIKKLGGPENVDWEDILPRLPAPTRRFVETKLVANEDLRGERQLAVEQARKDPNSFERQQVEARSKVLFDTANHYLSGLPWTAPQAVPANAKPEDKTRIESDNAFAKETQDRIAASLKEYSPARFAELAVGTAMAYKFKRDLENVLQASQQQRTQWDALVKERDTLKAELEKIKKAGMTHRRTSATPPAAPPNHFTESGASALDRLRDELNV